jgi:hypothetical protein
VVVVPRVTAGPDEAALAAAREELRPELAFLYSTPTCQRTLELFGLHDIGSRLSGLAHKKESSALARVLTGDVLEQLVPQGTYAELPALLRSQYGGLCDRIALDTPADPWHDDEFAAIVGLIRSVPAKVS